MSHETETHVTLQKLHSITEHLTSTVAALERRVETLERRHPGASLDRTEEDDA